MTDWEVRGQESVIVIAGVKAPLTDGVPDTTPVLLLIVSPVGKPVAPKVSGAIPPAV